MFLPVDPFSIVTELIGSIVNGFLAVEVFSNNINQKDYNYINDSLNSRIHNMKIIKKKKDKEIIDYLKYNLRSQMFAKALPMIQTVGALKRLELLRNYPELKDKLWVNVNALQNGLKERRFNIGDTNTCVTPVYLEGSIPEAMVMVNDLRENYGIFLSIVVYPVIPKGIILLRMIPTASHTLEDINETLTAFNAIREKLENGIYKKIADETTVDVS